MIRAAVLSLLLLTSACSLQPVYSGGSKSAAANMLASVDVPAIDGRAGYFLRQALLDRFGSDDGSSYRLQIKLDDEITGIGVRGDDSISRERRTLRARWQLVENASATVIIDATARTDEGIDVVSSEYAVLAAENAALERLADDIAGQITARIAQFARDHDVK